MNTKQILTITAFSTALRQGFEFIERDIAQTERDLFRTSDTHALPLLKYLHKVAGFNQGGVCSSIQPSKPTAKNFDEQYILAELMTQRLGHAGFTVTTKSDLNFAIHHLRTFGVALEGDPSQIRRDDFLGKGRPIDPDAALKPEEFTYSWIEIDKRVWVIKKYALLVIERR